MGRNRPKAGAGAVSETNAPAPITEPAAAESDLQLRIMRPDE